MKILVGLIVAAVAAICCLIQADTGAAPEDIHHGAEPINKGGAAAFDDLNEGDAGTSYEVTANNAEAVRQIRRAADQAGPISFRG
jgi:hypothetical protein